MKKYITVVLLMFIGFSVQAQVKKNKNAKYATDVLNDEIKKPLVKGVFENIITILIRQDSYRFQHCM